MVQEMLGKSSVPSGTEVDEQLHTKKDTKETGRMLKQIDKLEKGEVPDRKAG